MGTFADQPWYVNLTIVCLPVVIGAILYYFIRGRSCGQCGHQATKRHQLRHYCDRCFRKKFAGPLAVFQQDMPANPTDSAATAAIPRPFEHKKKSTRRQSKKMSGRAKNR